MGSCSVSFIKSKKLEIFFDENFQHSAQRSAYGSTPPPTQQPAEKRQKQPAQRFSFDAFSFVFFLLRSSRRAQAAKKTTFSISESFKSNLEKTRKSTFFNCALRFRFKWNINRLDRRESSFARIRKENTLQKKPSKKSKKWRREKIRFFSLFTRFSRRAGGGRSV